MPFREVIGHRRLVSLLARSVRRESLPPSLIFAGPRGIGKRLTATALAQALNCLTPRIATTTSSTASESASNPQGPAASSQSPAPGPESLELDACGVCAACTRIARGVHPDVLVIEPGDSGAIKIEQIRDMVDRAAYRPFEGKRRVVIIDEADALVVAAQNGLLKTLEEPPSASVFILLTARLDVLLPTVRSRCPVLRFRPLNPADLATALVSRGWNETEARAVAASADGSVGGALEASATDIVEAREIAQRVLAQAATSTDPSRRVDAAKDLLAKTGAGGATDREQLASHLRAMASLLRDVELLAVSADARTLANADVRDSLDRLTTAYAGDRGTRAFAAVDKALIALQRNAGVKIVADWLVLNL
jgi:DNA polymerase-3 subunit delta'